MSAFRTADEEQALARRVSRDRGRSGGIGCQPSLAPLGLRGSERGPRLRWKQEPLPVAYVASTLGAVGLFEFLPYLEELWRDWRAHPGRLVPPVNGKR